jgi:N-acetylglucosaminyl-diphospho-decaprenol L-rhamnosyltransferase
MSEARGEAVVDVVVVSYNSRGHLRACVEPLAGLGDIRVLVVDNASPDGSLESVADLELTRIQLETNGGFAHGCNAGWRCGGAAFVLFLNPDSVMAPEAVRGLAAVLEADGSIGAVAPRILEVDGSLALSQRRYPSPSITFSQGLYVHRIFPDAAWADDIVRDEDAYAEAGSPEWVSGACILVRRAALEELGGLDERFFMYCEDVDLCLRLRRAGWGVRYEPSVTLVHDGGGSAPRASLLPVLAQSRVLYAQKHFGPGKRTLERVGLAVGAAAHAVGSRGARGGHARSVVAVLAPGRDVRPAPLTRPRDAGGARRLPEHGRAEHQ